MLGCTDFWDGSHLDGCPISHCSHMYLDMCLELLLYPFKGLKQSPNPLQELVDSSYNRKPSATITSEIRTWLEKFAIIKFITLVHLLLDRFRVVGFLVPPSSALYYLGSPFSEWLILDLKIRWMNFLVKWLDSIRLQLILIDFLT